MNLSDMAVVVTALKRPYYLSQTLDSWAAAVGVLGVRRFAVALGRSSRGGEQCGIIGGYRPQFNIDVWPDSNQAAWSPGMHRAIGEAGNRVFSDSDVKFAVFGEEDVIVSDRVLQYMEWASHRFASNPLVLAVCAHNQYGQGWDRREPPADQDADPSAVRLLPYFSPWVWGTWPDRWRDVLEPEWDWECDSGGEFDSGYDWNIHARILKRHGMLCAVPDASLSQNIGRLEGWAATEASWEFSQSLSFRPVGADVSYRVVPE